VEYFLISCGAFYFFSAAKIAMNGSSWTHFHRSALGTFDAYAFIEHSKNYALTVM
tara:strand:- start:278 stop:442 length:165 start_codon:yes stop_codon:yes gene_type:complete